MVSMSITLPGVAAVAAATGSGLSEVSQPHASSMAPVVPVVSVAPGAAPARAEPVAYFGDHHAQTQHALIQQRAEAETAPGFRGVGGG